MSPFCYCYQTDHPAQTCNNTRFDAGVSIVDYRSTSTSFAGGRHLLGLLALGHAIKHKRLGFTGCHGTAPLDDSEI